MLVTRRRLGFTLLADESSFCVADFPLLCIHIVQVPLHVALSITYKNQTVSYALDDHDDEDDDDIWPKNSDEWPHRKGGGFYTGDNVM